MQKRKLLNSPRLLELKRKRVKILINKLLLTLLGILLILSGLTFLSRVPRFNINQIEISGNKIIDTKLIEEIVDKNLSGKYFWLFTKTNFLLYPKNRILKELTIKFKRLQNISISTKNIKTLEISVLERKAKYTWCGPRPPILDETEKCYFLDANGYIFDEAPYFSGEVYFKFYGSVVGLPLSSPTTKSDDPSGSYLFQKIFTKLILFKEDVEKINLKPVAFYLEDNNKVHLFLSPANKSSTKPEIILTSDLDFVKIVKNLEAAVWTTEPLKTDFIKKYSSLLYIDLRFGNKIYYKFLTQDGSVSGVQ